MASVRMGEPLFGLANFIGVENSFIWLIPVDYVLFLDFFDHVNVVIYRQTYSIQDF